MPDESARLSPAVSDQRDHIQGPSTAAVTLVEYGDYECPYCGQAYLVLKKLMPQSGDRVRLVFRNFPLAQLHPHAQRAAETAEAAGAQGKFWAMHNVLYERQDALEDEDLLAYADELGLNLDRFQTELSQGIYTARVREDFLGGVRSGVNGTPTFFFNGRRHDGGFDLESLTEAVVMSMSLHGPRSGAAHHRPRA